ncbi:MAG: hypothetical protein QOE54_6184 [Streptosporangiaceae bacterium]|jgi:hypothetical protein|nr:hypothetical protein [Streptosporangiaceae bacterium]MDX6433818.1 hypothetical protein [Streptosporangiaceae bacterium]
MITARYDWALTNFDKPDRQYMARRTPRFGPRASEIEWPRKH